jgi:hypothetical protein
MHRASLLALLALTAAFAGCTEQQRADPGPTPDDGRDPTLEAGGNATLGNQTAHGNATMGGNSSEAHGNETATNQTSSEGEGSAGDPEQNRTIPPRELLNTSFTYSGMPPADGALLVDLPYAELEVTTQVEGVMTDVTVTLVDPSGIEVVVHEGGMTTGGADPEVVVVMDPAQGAWTIEFDGTGMGSVHLTIVGRSP